MSAEYTCMCDLCQVRRDLADQLFSTEAATSEDNDTDYALKNAEVPRQKPDEEAVAA